LLASFLLHSLQVRAQPAANVLPMVTCKNIKKRYDTKPPLEYAKSFKLADQVPGYKDFVSLNATKMGSQDEKKP